MKIINNRLTLKTKGNGDLVNLTDEISQMVHTSKMKNGNVILFNIGSTAAITTFEFEPGLIRDVQELYEKLIPRRKHYHHDETWGDANGFSH